MADDKKILRDLFHDIMNDRLPKAPEYSEEPDVTLRVGAMLAISAQRESSSWLRRAQRFLHRLIG